MKLSINIELDTDMKWFTERQWYTKLVIVLVALVVIISLYEKCNKEPDYQEAAPAATEEVAPAAEEMPISE